jgi:SAM-dependent methyltransferase
MELFHPRHPPPGRLEARLTLMADRPPAPPSPPVALAQLLYESGSIAAAERALAEAAQRVDPNRSSRAHEQVRAMQELLRRHRHTCRWIARVARVEAACEANGADTAAAVAACARLFDWAVGQSEAGSVAAYSLGSPALLAEATREVVHLLEQWQVLGPDRVVLDIGCGIGRIACAIAHRVREVHAIDISPRMVAAAQRRCRAFPNVHVARCSGQDLAHFADRRFRLVCAVDTFPYVLRAGAGLVSRYIAEIARVLVPGGDFVLINYSYRDDSLADRRDVAALARAGGFDVLVDGSQPFTLWDGMAFHLRRHSAKSASPRPASVSEGREARSSTSGSAIAKRRVTSSKT